MLNWSRATKLSLKSQVLLIKDEEHLISVLKGRKDNQKVKVLGSGMSYLAIGAVSSDDDIMLDLSQLSGVISINEQDGATFGGSTVLQTIVDTLLANNQQLIACPGVLVTQTIAGAIATGTHGQDMKNGGVYDAILRMRVVLADGSVKEYTREGSDANSDFHGFRLHLGCLGVVTQVTLRTEKVKVYRLAKAMTDFEDLQRNYVAWNEAAEHTKAWWFPESDDVQLWRTFVADEEHTKMYHDNGSVMYQIPESSTVMNRKADNFSKSIEHLVMKMDLDTKSVSEEIKDQDTILNRAGARFDTVNRFKSLNHCLGNMYQLWCKGRILLTPGIPAPQVNCEIAIPLVHLSAALSKLRIYYRQSGNDMHYPFILRATGASDAWMSPAYNRQVCYIGFLVYLSEEYNGDQDRLKTLRDIEEVLAEFEAVPHYGKFFTKDLYDLKKRLPMMGKFEELKKRVDPEGVFSNDYVEKLFA